MNNYNIYLYLIGLNYYQFDSVELNEFKDFFDNYMDEKPLITKKKLKF